MEIIAQLHLERVVELECSLEEEKMKSENLNCLLRRASEMSTKSE